MTRVVLREITSDEDRLSALSLRLAPGQERYVGSVAESLIEAEEEARAIPHPWTVHDAESGRIVGFAMISDGIPEPIDEDLVGPYYLWKLLIDAGQQRRGYGAATLDAVIAYVRTRPGADVLYTSCADGEGSPREFYLRYGFIDTGRVMWGENVLAYQLGAAEAFDAG